MLMTGASLVLFLSLGIRHGFGLFLTPMSHEYGWGRETFAIAMALQNLAWGVAQPFAGAIADRFGTRKTIITGALLYSIGLILMGFANSPFMLSFSAGLLIGMGLSGTTFSVILGVIGRSVAPEKRSMAMGIVAAAGSFGQFAMLPGSLGLIQWVGWAAALVVLGMMVALIIPAASLINDTSSAHPEPEMSMSDALREALAHKGFWLLSLGFFVCGFQVVFIGVHLPAYLMDNHLPVIAGTTALALIGLFNVFGTYIAGWLGGRYSKSRLLSMMYLIRALVIILFISSRSRYGRPIYSAWQWVCYGFRPCR